jgi:methyl-accepting chemotaxis protein
MIMKIKYSTRLSLLLVLSCLFIASVLSGVALYHQSKAVTRGTAELRKTLYDDYDKAARNEVETAVSILQAAYERSQKGEMTLEGAKKLAADTVRSMRYDKGNYFWIDAFDGTNIAIMGKPSEGTNRIGLQDKKGKFIVKEFIANSQKPGGDYLDYWFPRPGSDVPFPKRGYSLSFQPFGWMVGTGNYVDDMEATIKSAEGRYRAELHRSTVQFVAITVFALLMALGVAFVFSRKMMAKLGGEPDDIATIAESIAAGDLTMAAGKDARSHTGIYSAVLAMATKLQFMVTEITHHAHDMASSSTELLRTSALMAQGTDEVVAQSNTVATAGEEMAATSNDIAQNCHLVAGSAKQANRAAADGADVVRHTIEVMASIADRVKSAAQTVEHLGARSDQIGEIIGTIEDIADQTNLLALNAAIEAARAGEQGRGFAVVADEVRALAERTTRATKEIGGMIKAIQQETRSAVSAMVEGSHEVERGTLETARSGKALEEIMEQINAVSEQASQIATAAEEQTATTSEISSNMLQITEVVQGTARGAEETSQAAKSLSAKSGELQRMVGQFKLS